jgi:hypothetical protein
MWPRVLLLEKGGGTPDHDRIRYSDLRLRSADSRSGVRERPQDFEMERDALVERRGHGDASVCAMRRDDSIDIEEVVRSADRWSMHGGGGLRGDLVRILAGGEGRHRTRRRFRGAAQSRRRARCLCRFAAANERVNYIQMRGTCTLLVARRGGLARAAWPVGDPVFGSGRPMYRPPHLREIAGPRVRPAAARHWHSSCAHRTSEAVMRVSLLSCSAVLFAAVALGCGSEVAIAKSVDHTDPPAQAPNPNAEGTAFETTPSAPAAEAPPAIAASSESTTPDTSEPPPGNNGVGNGTDPAPKGSPPANDSSGSSPGNPDRKDDH